MLTIILMQRIIYFWKILIQTVTSLYWKILIQNILLFLENYISKIYKNVFIFGKSLI